MPPSLELTLEEVLAVRLKLAGLLCLAITGGSLASARGTAGRPVDLATHQDGARPESLHGDSRPGQRHASASTQVASRAVRGGRSAFAPPVWLDHSDSANYAVGEPSITMDGQGSLYVTGPSGLVRWATNPKVPRSPTSPVWKSSD